MDDFSQAVYLAFNLIFSIDYDLYEIIGLSLQVSFLSVFFSCCIGLFIGAFIAVTQFPGRNTSIIIINSLMGLPPVVVGLIVYLMLSNRGPFGWLELLYSPTAMIIAQTILITPIIASLSCQIISDLRKEYQEQFLSMCVPRFKEIQTLLWEARFSLVTVILAGFGRSIAEVGAVIIVGGNINHLTRVMTTSIALETSKGELAFAMALGIILMFIAISINALVMTLRQSTTRFSHA